MNAVLIFNPKSGKGKAPLRAKYFQQRWKHEIGTELTLRPTSSYEDLRIAAKETNSQQVLQIFMGGDGTMSECLQGLFEKNSFQPLKTPIALLPGGSGDSFLRDFGLDSYEKAAEALFAAVKRDSQVDIDAAVVEYQKYDPQNPESRGVATKRISFNIWGIGLVADIGKLAVKMRFLGSWSYTVATILLLLKHKSKEVSAIIDGEEKEFSANFFSVSNSRFTGGAMEMAPAVRVNDGKLFLVVSEIQKRAKLFGLFPSIFKGQHVQDEKIFTTFVRELQLFRDEAFFWNVDGELDYGFDPKITIKPAMFPLMMPMDLLQ